jgi:imidazolonepropionase-like amidohydrolase
VKLALGSDSYREDSVPESAYIDSLHVFDPPSLLNIWCKTIARTIFPLRRVGELREGYEVSFLVLSADPLHDFGATQKIRLRVKQGHIIEIHDLPPGSATKSGN